MARQDFNVVTHNAKGHVGKKIVYRQYRGRTIMCDYPNMSNVVKSEDQKKDNSLFARAVAFGKAVKDDLSKMPDPNFTQGDHLSVYHAAVSWYKKMCKGT